MYHLTCLMYYLTLGNFKVLKITTLASNCRYPVVVSIAVSKMVMTELIFVNSGMKVKANITVMPYSLSRCCQRSSVLQTWSSSGEND